MRYLGVSKAVAHICPCALLGMDGLLLHMTGLFLGSANGRMGNCGGGGGFAHLKGEEVIFHASKLFSRSGGRSLGWHKDNDKETLVFELGGEADLDLPRF